MNDDYIGRHRPTDPQEIADRAVMGGARDAVAQLIGYFYIPRNSSLLPFATGEAES